MPKSVDIDIENDGARNTVLNINICLDSPKGIGPVVILDPAERYVDPTMPTHKYRIDHINYVLHRDLAVDLWWDDETPKLIRHLEGRGMVDRHLHNTAGDKKTGKVLLTASGFKEGEALKGSLTIEAVKQ